MTNGINEQWLKDSTTITREELGSIIAHETATVLDAVGMVFEDDPSTKELFEELFITFGAGIATRIFDIRKE